MIDGKRADVTLSRSTHVDKHDNIGVSCSHSVQQRCRIR